MMKIRIADRILVAVAGLILVLLSVCLVDQTILSLGVCAAMGRALKPLMDKPDHWMYIAAVVAAAALLLLLGLYCVAVLFRHQKRGRRGFVVQQTDCGELSIAMKAIEGLVQKCVDRHEEINVMSTSLDTTRDGLIIKLRIGLAGGVNIPLAVSALQKQIKQYVTSCSGVDVREVKVQVETSAGKGTAAKGEMELPEKNAPLPMVEDKTPAITAASMAVEMQEEKKRPLHQRIFGRGEEPVTVAAPPAPVAEPVLEAAETSVPQVAEESEQSVQSEAEPVEAVETAKQETELEIDTEADVDAHAAQPDEEEPAMNDEAQAEDNSGEQEEEKREDE